MENAVFIELAILILVTVFVAGLMRVLKQPIIIGYIVAGIVLSPYLLNVVESTDSIATFAQIGVTILLFMVGLNLNPRLIRDVGKVALITGVGQVLLTFVAGFGLMRLFGFTNTESIYVATALTFSSTIVILKLLSDKGDIETLYGRISVGLLIVQDVIAILALMVVSSMSDGFSVESIVLDTVIRGMFLTAFLFIFGLKVMPKFINYVATSQEYLLLFSIGWCMAVAAAFELVGFSMEIGALLAGFTLSLSPFRYEISSKIKPLRDFFIVIFFVLLGTQMQFENIWGFVLPVFVISIFILVAKPLIVMIIMGLLSYKKRNSFLTGLAMAQISEFSLILLAMGVKVGHIGGDILSFVTMVGLITIAGSSYFVIYGNKIYRKLSKFLSIFERKGKKADEHRYHGADKYDILLIGYSRIGLNLLDSFKQLKKKYLVVDYNPEVILELAKEGVDCRYGDIDDSETLDELNLNDVKMVISTVKNYDTNLLLLTKMKEINDSAIVIVVAHQLDQALKLYELGASYVLMPNMVGGYHTSLLINDYGLDIQKFLTEKARHMQALISRKEKGHRAGIDD